MNFVEWLTVLGVSAKDVLKFIRDKLKTGNEDYDAFSRSLRSYIEVACDSYRQYMINSHDYEDKFFQKITKISYISPY